MKALLFVYSDAQFRIAGAGSIRQFPFKTVSFDQAHEVARSGDVKLSKGIYAVFAEHPKLSLKVEAISGTAGVDYDTTSDPTDISGKDTWPDPKLTSGSVNAAIRPVYDRVHKAFSDLNDAQLKVFIDDGRSV